MPTRSILLTLSLLAAATAVPAATIYRWVDAQGVVHYSDTPHEGADQVNVAAAQGYEAPPPPAAADTPAAASQPDYSSCAITAPTAEQSLYAVQSVAISVDLQPGLRAGDQVEVSVDGRRLSAAGSRDTSFELSPANRGAHTVTLMVRDASGKTVCTAMPVTFYVRQPSILSPQSRVGRH